MERTMNLDRGWQFGTEPFSAMTAAMGGGSAREVNLPHDYMIESSVCADAPAGPAMGYFTGRVAYYTKHLTIPAEWSGERIFLHFDGIMMNATIEVNGSRVLLHHYGYTPVWADITPYLSYGKENRVTVAVNPSMQPNSRWYTGAGIFRSVELVHVPQIHIAGDGIYVTTPRIEWKDGEAAEAYLRAEVTVCNHTAENHVVQVDVTLCPDADGPVSGAAHDVSAPDAANGGASSRHGSAACDIASPLLLRSAKIQVNAGSEAAAVIPITVVNPLLWDIDTPNLYQVSATVTDLGTFGCMLRPADSGLRSDRPAAAPVTDTASVITGIRTVTADAVHGLRVNGRTVKLKGGCIHHDNGILGAVSLYDSEYRKVRKLKESGFNLVRMAHNPPSAALLEACDRLGMYVFDEAFDAWRIAKQPGDYSQFFEADWKADLKAFLLRDRSHPSILLWSTGNEIVERGGLGDGYALAMELAAYTRSLDSSRLITNGLCSFWSGLDDESMIASMQRLKDLMAKRTQKTDASVSATDDAQNPTAPGTPAASDGDIPSGGVMQNASAPVTDTFWEERTEPFASFLDVVGYNYMEDHYELAKELYPERVILGTESYPTEIDRVWDYVERLPYVIGDCTWTAFDYIGEAGIGKSVFALPDDPIVKAGPYGLMSHTSDYPWRLANDADFDINGNLTPQGAYRRIVWGSAATSLYTADPAQFGRTEVVSKWGWPALSDSWNWEGCEGAPIRVVVYSAADEVELFLNDRSLGTAAAGKKNRYTASFDIAYEPGTLRAVSRTNGAAISEDRLCTAGAPAAIRLTAEPRTAGGTPSGNASDREPACTRPADGHSLAYICLDVVDADGRRVPNAAIALRAEVTGAATLAGFGSANPVTEENYTAGSFTSYQGRALAVLRSGYEPGTATLTVRADGLPEASVDIVLE